MVSKDIGLVLQWFHLNLWIWKHDYALKSKINANFSCQIIWLIFYKKHRLCIGTQIATQKNTHMFSTLAMTIEIQKNLKSVINSKSIIIQEFRLGQPQPTNFEQEFDSNLKLPHFFKRKHNNFFSTKFGRFTC